MYSFILYRQIHLEEMNSIEIHVNSHVSNINKSEYNLYAQILLEAKGKMSVEIERSEYIGISKQYRTWTSLNLW